jgi:hypothetical protein
MKNGYNGHTYDSAKLPLGTIQSQNVPIYCGAEYWPINAQRPSLVLCRSQTKCKFSLCGNRVLTCGLGYEYYQPPQVQLSAKDLRVRQR